MPAPRMVRVLLAAVAVSVTGCSFPQRVIKPSDIRPLPYATWRGNGAEWSYVRIRGLDSALAESPEAPVRVLVVHGMRTHQPGYSAVLQRGLAGDRLNFITRPISEAAGDTVDPVPVTRGYDIEIAVGPQPLSRMPLRQSELRRRLWADPRDGRVRLVFYELLWAPLRDDVKHQFFACFEVVDHPNQNCPVAEARQNTDRQAFANEWLKENILIDGFGDATIVLGPVGDVLRDDVGLALCLISVDVLTERGFALQHDASKRCDLATAIQPQDRARANEALRDAEFFASTHSLGSFLLMDALWTAADTVQSRLRSADDELTAVRDVASFYLLDDATVFMRANQFSLLNLARLGAVCVPRAENARCPTQALPDLEDLWNAPAVFGMFTQYVAFNDVNDLLGFELPPYIASAGMAGTLVNVSVRNPALRLPGLKEPGGAHNNSDRNAAILNAMIAGFDIPKDRVPQGGTSAPR